MLIKSFVTVTTSYRNKNWESKLRMEGNDTDSKFWNQYRVIQEIEMKLLI
jgi:hypothetical protein